ncbi:MAG: DUF4416 family protein [Dissulfuribacterales bacterium]
MSQIRIPFKALLIHSLLAGEEQLIQEVLAILTERYGKTAFESGILPFHHTDYYEKEFGPNLKRLFAGFSELVPQDILVQAKLFAMELERRFSCNGKRLINIDPGILTLERLVLATAKNFTHRIYLGQGVFADLTLIFQKGGFRPLPWTFPDYKADEAMALWHDWRNHYKKTIKQGKAEIEYQGGNP